LDHHAIRATFPGQVIADAIRSIHRSCVEQHDGRDRQYLEEVFHEGEVKVYSSSGHLQQIRGGNAGGG
jgi:hypothetical protein